MTHVDFDRMLGSVDFDVLAVGDYYGRRGSLAVAALRAGKHVLSDKPLCTSMAELDEIERLAAGGLTVGAMLDMRDAGIFRGMRALVLEGRIGEVCAISFNGNHPLLLGRRPGWYFEEGRHGGTITDLGIHAFDAIPWVTGHSFVSIEAARSWDASGLNLPSFRNASQVMATLDNGCGVLGDLSYLVPDSIAYKFPDYWRFAFTGTRGVLMGGWNDASITLYQEGEPGGKSIPASEARPGGYLLSFLHELASTSQDGELTTRELLAATRVSLLAQAAADVPRHGA